MKNISRRDFLKLSSCGMAAIAVGAAGGYGLLWRDSEAMAASQTLTVTIIEAEHEMTDLVRVPVWAYSINGTTSVPGTAIFAVEGDDLEINVTNNLTVDHAFSVPGVVDSGSIAPRQTVQVKFKAPQAGTYMYLDPLNAPVNRVMGLYGALVVLPRLPVTPYSNPTSTIKNLFEDFGTAPHFPGHPWDPSRTWIWIVASVDPVKNALAANTPTVSSSTFTTGYAPRYFMINGKSGFFSSYDHSIEIAGNQGQPTLIRTMNAGLSWHSLHTHFNHCYILAVDGVPQSNLWLVDVWTVGPMDRKDVLMPFIQPPDIPVQTWNKILTGTNQERLPMAWPMHCHLETSQTAAGGNYPNGMLAHMKLTGPVSAANEVIVVEEADVRIKFGRIRLKGRASAGSQLTIFAGPPSDNKVVGTLTVPPSGRWVFEGRALRSLSNRTISVVSNGTGASRLNVRCLPR